MREQHASQVAAMERLVGVVQELSLARTMDAIVDIVRHAARELTGADGATFVLRDGDCCFYVDEDAIEPLWKGSRFPMSACISGWVMLNARTALIPDIYKDDRIPAEAYRPTFVKSLAMVPIRRQAPLGAIGVYWATRRQPSEQEVAILSALADSTSVAIRNHQLYSELAGQVEALRLSEARIQRQCEALGVYTRSLAHDLKEPTRTVRMFSGMIESALAQEQVRERELLKHVREAGERMERVLDKVYLYTRLDDPQNLETEDVDLNQVAGEVVDNLAALLNEVQATVTLSALPRVTANRMLMGQLLQNLVANAAAHGGESPRIHVGSEGEADYFRVFVRDWGPGIETARLGEIFEPFKRLTHDVRHTGLGLAIARKIVEQCGGSIVCQASPGHGAKFSFSLPGMREGSPPAALTPPTKVDEQLAVVLLVDDREPDIILAREMLFGKQGITCDFIVARDGREALDVLEQRTSAEQRVDLVLLDINMPVMDGFETLERLRSTPRLQDIPVIMCSGSTYDLDERRARELGAIGYIEKPPTVDQLTRILSSTSQLRVFEAAPAPPRLVRVPERIDLASMN